MVTRRLGEYSIWKNSYLEFSAYPPFWRPLHALFNFGIAPRAHLPMPKSHSYWAFARVLVSKMEGAPPPPARNLVLVWNLVEGINAWSFGALCGVRSTRQKVDVWNGVKWGAGRAECVSKQVWVPSAYLTYVF